MYFGRYSDKYSGVHGESGGKRGGKKRIRHERSVALRKLRDAKTKEEAEKAAAELKVVNTMHNMLVGIKSGFGGMMRAMTRRRG